MMNYIKERTFRIVLFPYSAGRIMGLSGYDDLVDPSLTDPDQAMPMSLCTYEKGATAVPIYVVPGYFVSFRISTANR